ncbi:uncharacterized protein PFL1_06393 [Pseudozyma flocculosa PF-1]|uniref:CCDC174 alpha/beta GRSR domain-containing protein n=1 Tax=Pseudozyma flocculosa PF-1 TaxID=1277687 RepID=A0A061H139_9BASI|nr:uncharacterized protein PFL1_06393 [Pseudozyma flocculosa PF-1]EPQ25938.1 hypothetical protein PFL1_06393 [Pseudozyma flocculosa PF-1]
MSRPSGSSSSRVGHSSFLSLKADLESLKHDRPSSSSSPSSSLLGKRKTASTSRLSSTFLDTAPTSTRTRKRGNGGEGGAKTRATSAWSHTPSAQLDEIRTNLERKARIYDRLSRGLHAGIDDEELKESVVDWDAKIAAAAAVDEEEDGGRRSPSASSSSSRDQENDYDDAEGDEEIEYVDDLGRTRRARKRDIPREFLPVSLGGRLEEDALGPGAHGGGGDDEDTTAIYGPSTSFPVYRPPSPVMAARRSKLEATAHQERHFDADWEVRQRGAAFYRFAKDGDERRRQMQRLQDERDTTEAKRRGGGGADDTTASAQARVEAVRRSVLGDEAYEARRRTIEDERLLGLLPASASASASASVQ